jgi:hypothetical protein
MEFEIKGVKYRTAKLSVFEQLKVSKAVAGAGRDGF